MEVGDSPSDYLFGGRDKKMIMAVWFIVEVLLAPNVCFLAECARSTYNKGF